MNKIDFRVIGAGLAGSEAALTLAACGYSVEIFEQKPVQFSAAHKLPGAAELVCSNSFKSTELSSSHGLLKAELEFLGSPLLEIAQTCRLPGGSALTIDREKFSEAVTQALKNHPQIHFVNKPVEDFFEDDIPVLIATGPLTSDALMNKIRSLLADDGLYFYDATSPVIALESLNLEKFFWASRNQEDSDDYLNLPLSKEEYLGFHQDLLTAEKMPGHLPEEDLQFFEGCLPIEVLASRGEKTLCFGPMKPVGFSDPKAHKAEAIIQFRREKAAAELVNMVGFQTRMKWPEQERVFRKLPGMENAQFVRLGAMHRNSFINAPRYLTNQLNLKTDSRIYFAGQITGSEGYTEALATGHYAALQMMGAPALPEVVGIRSLVRYLIHSDPKYFQPMNFNFGLLPPLDEKPKRHGPQSPRQAAKLWKSERSLKALKEWRAKEGTKQISA